MEQESTILKEIHFIYNKIKCFKRLNWLCKYWLSQRGGEQYFHLSMFNRPTKTWSTQKQAKGDYLALLWRLW